MDGYLVKITPDRCAHLVPCSEVPITFTHHARLLGEDFGWIDHHRGEGLSVLADTAADEPRNEWASAYTGRTVHGDAIVAAEEMGEDVPLDLTQATAVLSEVFLIGGIATALHSAAAIAAHHRPWERS